MLYQTQPYLVCTSVVETIHGPFSTLMAVLFCKCKQLILEPLVSMCVPVHPLPRSCGVLSRHYPISVFLAFFFCLFFAEVHNFNHSQVTHMFNMFVCS